MDSGPAPRGASRNDEHGAAFSRRVASEVCWSVARPARGGWSGGRRQGCALRTRFCEAALRAASRPGNEAELPARPDVEDVAVCRADLVDPARGGGFSAAGALAMHLHQRAFDVGLHFAAVAADIDDGALL